MSGKCSICLSTFKEPVCIPCGHVYCTKCLADHVNTPGDTETKSSCPTCRTVFNTVTPDLTYLPKKYHQYVVPSVRRVYLEAPAQDLQKKLMKAEARIRKLERDQEILLDQCEQYMSASSAHAEGERASRLKVDELKKKLIQVTAKADMDKAILEHNYDKLEGSYRELVSDLVTDEPETSSNSTSRRRKSKNLPEQSELSISMPCPPASLSDTREIRPLPRSRSEQSPLAVPRASAVSPPHRPKRQRLLVDNFNLE